MGHLARWLYGWRVCDQFDSLKMPSNCRFRSPDEVTARIDNLIQQVKALQAPHMKDVEPKDIVLVAHGHSTRAFAKRWLGFDLSTQFDLMMEPGGVGVLSYQHGNIDEPALVLGVALPLTHN